MKPKLHQFAAGFVACCALSATSQAVTFTYSGAQNAMNQAQAPVATYDTVEWNISSGYFGTSGARSQTYSNANLIFTNVTMNNGWSEAVTRFSSSTTVTGAGTFSLTSAGLGQDFVFAGNMQGYSGSVSIADSGNATLTLGNTGSSLVQYGGETAGGDTALGTITTDGSGSWINNVAGSGSITANNLVFNYATHASYDYVKVTNAITQRDSVNFIGNANVLASGVISGVGVLNKSGGGVLTLEGNNTFTGATTVSAGTLKLAHASALGTTAAGTTVSATGAALDLNGQTIGAEALTLNGTGISNGGALINSSATAASHSGTIALGSTSSLGGSGDTTLSGVISGVGFGLTKVGGGTVTLNNANTYSGNTTIGAGTLALGASGSLANSPTISVTSGAVFDISASSFALGGSQTLNAGRTSSFAMDVNGTLASGGTINPAASGTKGTLTVAGGLTLTGGILNFDLTGGTFTAGNGVNDLISASGALNLSGTTTVNATWTGSPVTGTYTLISGSSLGSGSAANLAKGAGLTNGPRISFAFDEITTPGTVYLNVTGGPAAITWVGDGVTNAWDVGGTANWDNGGADNFYDLDNVTFNDSSPNGSVSLGVTVSPGSVTVNNTTTAYSFSGAGKISGTGSLTKTGTGTLTLSTTGGNDYTGGTVLSQGTIVATTSSALSSSGTITINDAGTSTNNTTLNLDATGGSVTIARAINVANQGAGTTTIGTVTASGSNQSIYSGAIMLGKSVTLKNGAAGDRLQFSGGISGTGDVTVDGVSNAVKTVLIGAANTFNGNVYITGNGRLQLSDGSSSSANLIPDTASVNLNTSGGVFNLAKGGNNETIDALNGVAGTSVNAVSGSDTLTLGSNGGSGSYAGNITGSLTLTKTGAGTQSLSGTNTYTGATTTISGGTLAVSGGSAIPDAGTVSIGSGAKFQVNASETIGTLTTVAGSTVEAASGTLTFTAGSLVGNLTGSGTVLRNGTSDSATSQFTTADALNFNGALQLRGSTPSANPGSMQGGTGRFWLNSANGTQAAGTAFALDTGASAANAQDLIIGDWDATSGNRRLTLSSLSGYGTIRTDAGGAGARNLIVDQSGGDTTFNGMLLSHRSTGLVDREIAFEKKGTSTLVMAGIVGSQTAGASGTASLTVTVSGGTLELNAANTYTGATTVNSSGTLKLGNTSALGITAVGTTVNSGGRLDLNGQTIVAEALTLSGTGIGNSGALVNSSATAASWSGGVTLAANTTIGADNAITLSGVVSESSAGLGLTKTGAGVLTLGGANEYTGSTTVSQGTLVIDGSISTGNLAVESGATLMGGGTIGGATTIDSGATLSPGNSPGLLTVNNALTLAGTTLMEIGGTTIETEYDSIDVSGLLTYGGILNIISYNSYNLAQAASYNLFGVGGGETGTFNSVSVGGLSLSGLDGVWSAENAGYTYTFTESTGTLVVIPEPAAALLGGVGMLLLLRRRRVG